MIKELVRNILHKMGQLITSPTKAWSEINQEAKSDNEIHMSYVFPLIYTCVAVVFAFQWMYEASLEIAFLQGVVAAASLFGGYFLVREASLAFLKRYSDDLVDRTDVTRLVAYSYTVIFVLNMVIAIAPSMFFLWVLAFYTFYLVSEGAKVILDNPESKHNNIVLVVSFMILIANNVLSLLMKMMILSNVAEL